MRLFAHLVVRAMLYITNPLFVKVHNAHFGFKTIHV